MRRSLLTWITVCGVVFVSTACAGLPVASPPAATTGLTATLPPALPQEAPAAETQPAQPEVPLLPAAGSTPLTLWPLDSNLYYLDEAGQVWRQPAAGDQTTAAVISRPDQKVTDFAIAPGEDWLAYRSGGAVITIAPASGSGQVLAPDAGTPVDPTQGRTIAWAPDASKLAYAVDEGFQVYLAGAGEDFTPLIYNVSTLSIVDLVWSPDSRWLLARQVDGHALLYQAETTLVLQVELGGLNGYTWLTDNRLAFAPAEGGLALLAPDDLASRTFMVGAEQPVSLPVQQADGRLAFFIHDETITRPGYLYAGDPTDLSFSAVSAAPVITTGMLWNPSGARLVRPGITAPGLILMLDPVTGAQAEYEVPTPVTSFDWGDAPPASDTPLTLPADLYYLAPQAGIVQVWRVPANGETPQAITSAPTDVLDYDVSLDGTQVVYSSGGGLSRQVIGTADLTELARLPDSATGASPSFSLSGGMVAFSSGGIWIVPSTSPQEARRLVADTVPQAAGQIDLIQRYSRPRWSPDGLWLSAHVTFFEGSDVALIPVNEPGVASQPILLNLFGAEARWMPDNAALIYSPGGPYSEPRVTRVQPADPLSISQIIDLPVLDVRLTDDARLALLRLPTPYGIGPGSVSVVSIQPSGGDLRQETGAVVLSDPALAPGGRIIAGLLNIRMNGDGPRAGQLVITDPVSGAVYTVREAAAAWSLQWGE